MQPKEIYSFFGIDIESADDCVRKEIQSEADRIAHARQMAEDEDPSQKPQSDALAVANFYGVQL